MNYLNVVSNEVQNLFEYFNKIREMTKAFRQSNVNFNKARALEYCSSLIGKLGNPYQLLNSPLRKISQFLIRYLFIFIQEEYCLSLQEDFDTFHSLVLKNQNTVSPQIIYRSTRNTSIQKNLSISA